MASEKIKKAFDLVCSDYIDMFKTHYPGASGGGLNEANQTYYFCKNLSSVINKDLSKQDVKSSVSLETPYGIRKRMDGVIVSPTTEEVFLIQAKRLKDSKTEHVISDINKVYDAKDSLLSKLQVSNQNISYKVYLVIIADMWLHQSTSRSPKDRLSIPKWWLGEESEELNRNFIQNRFHSELTPPDSYFVDETPQDLAWEHQILHRFYNYKEGLATKDILSEYCLLCGHTKI